MEDEAAEMNKDKILRTAFHMRKIILAVVHLAMGGQVEGGR
jgi:hypothetical protein